MSADPFQKKPRNENATATVGWGSTSKRKVHETKVVEEFVNPRPIHLQDIEHKIVVEDVLPSGSAFFRNSVQINTKKHKQNVARDCYDDNKHNDREKKTNDLDDENDEKMENLSLQNPTTQNAENETENTTETVEKDSDDEPEIAQEQKNLTFLRTTALTNDSTMDIICRWFLTIEDITKNPAVMKTCLQLFGEKNPDIMNALVAHNLEILKTREFVDLQEELTNIIDSIISETEFHALVHEFERTWNSMMHSANVLYALKVRKTMNTILPIPPFKDHVPPIIENIPKPDQELLDFIYRRAEKQGLKRDEKNQVYEPFFLKNGQHTYFYKHKCSLNKFIYGATLPKESFPYEHGIYTERRSTPGHMFDLISTMPDPRFPMLKKERNLFSTDTGILDIDTLTMYLYKKDARWTKSKHVDDLPTGTVTCNYLEGKVNKIWWLDKKARNIAAKIDLEKRELLKKKCANQQQPAASQPAASQSEFQAEPASQPRLSQEECREEDRKSDRLTVEQQRLVDMMKTLSIYKVFKSQDFDDDDVFWFCALLGRLLGKGDKKEIAPYLRGVAGAGKSTVLKLIMMLLQDCDIAQLQDDGRENFSDAHMIGKRLVVAIDIGTKPNFSKTRLISHISKEPIAIDVMYGDTISPHTPDANWILAGNGQFPWSDVSGNLARRFPTFVFSKMILKSDSELFTECLKERIHFLFLIMSMYNEMISLLGARSIWDKDDFGRPFLPSKVFFARQQYLMSCSSLSTFLEDSSWVLNKQTDSGVTSSHQVSEAEFNVNLKKYQHENHLKKSNLNTIEDQPIMNAFGIEFVQGKGHTKGSLKGVVFAPGR